VSSRPIIEDLISLIKRHQSKRSYGTCSNLLISLCDLESNLKTTTFIDNLNEMAHREGSGVLRDAIRSCVTACSFE
jgi:hypothetical protein